MNKTALSILISIILTIIIVSLVNVGTSLFLEEPEYRDYCPYLGPGQHNNQTACEQVGGIWYDESETISDEGMIRTTHQRCDLEKIGCQEEYESVREGYNQKRFYVFALIGFALLIFGLFAHELLLQITSLASGGILVFEGIVTNLEDKLIVFISLLAILVIFGILAYRVIRKK